jgi:hypothetical protein
MKYDGRCHCGNLEVTFETEKAPAAFPLRECACSFCRRHGATAATDPAGTLEIRARVGAEVSRYRFGLRSADFLVCRTCGVYVAAVCQLDGATYATLNCNVLDARAAFTQAPGRVDFDRETLEERLARRRRVWTPAVLLGLGVSAAPMART